MTPEKIEAINHRFDGLSNWGNQARQAYSNDDLTALDWVTRVNSAIADAYMLGRMDQRNGEGFDTEEHEGGG